MDENNPLIGDQIDLIFDDVERVKEFSGLPISTQMAEYKTRLYGILHGGYSLLVDSRANNQGTVIDGHKITTVPVRENGAIIGHKPSCPSKTVSRTTYINTLSSKGPEGFPQKVFVLNFLPFI